jgi:hypothetical protein
VGVSVSVAELNQVEEQQQQGRSRVRTVRYLRDGIIDDGWEGVPETRRRQTGRGRAEAGLLVTRGQATRSLGTAAVKRQRPLLARMLVRIASRSTPVPTAIDMGTGGRY